MSPQHRRDFLLDSGAISALAANSRLAYDYFELLRRRFNGSLLIPMPVIAEVRTGDPATTSPWTV